MEEHWGKVQEGYEREGGPNTGCSYYPCHFQGQDCTWCFCPLYPCLDPRLGSFVTSRKGDQVWSCQDCYWIHRPDVASQLKDRLPPGPRPSDDRLHAIKRGVEERSVALGRPIMVMGATSGAGKTLLVAALCRILSDLGYRVAPFKSQNMSLNSTVTARGEEISRAQALQALAARVEPEAHMNPVLLKPKKDNLSQVIVRGRPFRDMDVPTYYSEFTTTIGPDIVRESYHHLQRRFDAIVIEGAGSPAEINIADRDLANLRTAEIADAPCILVVNIEWGGAFAYIVGTLMLLTPEQRARFKGVLINNMYGDPSGLGRGIEEVEKLTGVPVLGVIPHIDHALPDEDSQDIASKDNGGLRIGVVRLPHISNFTDFDALELEKGTSVLFVDDPATLSRMDAIILPGSKNTVSDLGWLKERGLDKVILSRRGEAPIVGVCGGYQMLGRIICDPHGLEGDEGGTMDALGLLDATTVFDTYDKRTVQVEGCLACGEGRVRGYEIHMGRTETSEAPLFLLDDPKGLRGEGSRSGDGMVMGSYMHGLFDLPPFRRHLLSLASRGEARGEELDYEREVEASIARLAEMVRRSIDVPRLLRVTGVGK